MRSVLPSEKSISASVWNRILLGGAAGILLLLGAATILIDPFLHYHQPLEQLEYPLKDERYCNDGIQRHYEYSAMITGTSMTQNFKASQLEELWGEQAIKTSFSGATFHEVKGAIERALSYQENLRMVIRSLDGNRIICPADEDEYQGMPEYLYDDNPFNDVEYLFNKEVAAQALAVLNYTRAGNQTPTMDEYGSWAQYAAYGEEAVLRTVTELGDSWEETVLTDADRGMIRENVGENVLELALEHPDVTFYVFYPPYSIVYWRALTQTRQLEAQLEAEQLATEILLQADNIRIFAFADETEMVADLDNYMDSLHYGPWINEQILQWMYEGSHELNTENYEEYYQNIKEIYQNYPYDN